MMNKNLENKKTFCPPLSEDLFQKYDFFELYPMDGGGYLVQQELLGTLNDAKMTEDIVEKGALNGWGKFPVLDFIRHERWAMVEKSAWINRLYFVASLAHRYWLTRDERIARAVRDVILHFIRNYCPPRGKDAIEQLHRRILNNRTDYNRRSYEENQNDTTDIQYQWFDFQPASRVIHLIYAFYFLEDSPSLSDAQRSEIMNAIHDHAEFIMIEERHVIPLNPGNHQSLRGLSLLYAGAFFKGVGLGEDFVQEGLRICNYHIRNDFLADGVLSEISPSYHCFETWHMRDAFGLARRYGFDLIEDTAQRLEKAIVFIRSMCQPDGYSPVLYDGYSICLKPFLESLPAGAVSESVCCSCFEEAGLAFYRDRDRFLVMDGSPYTGQFSHYHAGKNAPSYWFRNQPFLIDSGCPSYEDPLFACWYKQSQAHSSLRVDDQGDGQVSGLYDWVSWATVRCGQWVREEHSFVCTSVLTSTAKGWNDIVWSRQLRVEQNGILMIADIVTSQEPKKLKFLYNLHPDVDVALNQTVLLKNHDVGLELSFDTSSQSDLKINLAEGKCFSNGKHQSNLQLEILLPVQNRVTLNTTFRPLL